MNTPSSPQDAALEQALRASRALEDAPESLIQRTVSAVQALQATRAQPAPAAPGLLQRVMAALAFDSAAAPALAQGVRSGGPASRQLLFTAQGHDVDLRITAAVPGAGDWWLLAGQVLGPQSQGQVSLADATGAVVTQCALSDMGEFRLAAVSRGRYTLNIRLGTVEVVLPELSVPHGQ
jgi:hypothetical protein